MTEKPTYEELEKKIQELEQTESNRKQSEEKLIRSYDLMDYIISHARSAIAIFDRDLKYIYVSKRYLKDYKVKEQNVIGKHHYEIFPDLPEKWKDVHQRSLTGEVVSAEEDPYYREDGSVHWTRWECRPWYGSNGSIGGIVIYNEIINERKQAEEALRLSEQRLATHLQNTPIGAISWDLDFKTVEWNQAAETIFGYTKKEAIGKQVTELILPEDMKELVIGIFQNLISEQGSAHSTNENITKDGERIICDWYNTALKDTDGKSIGIAALVNNITERKQTEKALINSEHKWRNILVNIPQIGITLNTKAKITFANAYFLQLTGWQEKEVIGQDWFDLFIPERVRKDVREVFLTVMSQKDTIGFSTYENQIIDRSGMLINVAWSNALTKDVHGNVIDVTCLGVDLTERQRSEQALKRSEERFKTLSTLTFEGILIHNHGVIIDSNYAATKMLGYAKEELVGENIIQLCVPQKYHSTIQENIVKNLVKPYEIMARRKDGTTFPVEIESRDIVDKNKKFRVTALRDITERKLAEEALKESEEKYRSMMEAMDDAVYICSSEYLIEYMNSAMIKRTGRDAIGELCHKAIHGLDEKCSWCCYDKVIMGKFINYEIISPKDDRTFHVSNSPIVHTDGSISKLTIFRDITKFKKMEVNLHQAHKMESIGTLAGGIAHDFNNILFPILGHTEMLLEDVPEDSPFRDSLNGIHTGALRASDLVKQILTFSRQDNNELKLIQIQHIVKEALKLIRSSIPTTIEIKQDIQADCGAIKADPIRIHQIIMNLATNAYHAMEKTGGVLKVNLNEIKLGELDLIKPDMTPGAYACLIVEDTGIGMDKNLTDKIFDPFFTTKEPGKGTGMGLSVIHGIVKNMEGAIQVSSEPGKGTKFNVYLPVEKSFSKKQVTHSKTKIYGGIENILLVDDEEAILSMEKQMLERLGYQVTSRVSSIEALEAFGYSPDKFDLVITDMAMPNMPGDKLSAELVKIRSDIPILLCTGFSETMSEEKATSLGIKGFLLKPIVMKDLSHKIREVLDGNKK